MRRYSILSLLILSGFCLPAAAQVSLKETVEPGSEISTRVHLVLRGKIHVGENDEDVAGQALLVYPEKVLTVTDDGPDSIVRPDAVVRFYEDARAKFVVGRSEDPRQLRPDLRLMVGKTEDNALSLWSPSGPLTSDELELIEDVLDTTQLVGLLPAGEAKVGDTWAPKEEVLRRLCDLETFITSTVEGKLTDVSDDEATISISGKIHGIDFGSQVKSNIEATILFDRKESIIRKVTWKQIDSRELSPVSPAGAYEVSITIDRSRSNSAMLAEKATANVDVAPADANKLLLFQDPKGRFRFLYDRNWHITLLEDERAILRRVVGTEMVSQLNIGVVAENENVTELSAAQLQRMMIESGELVVEEIIRSESLPTDGTFQLRLVTAKGHKGSTQLVQRNYIAQGSAGRQILLTFLTEPTLEDRLGDLDLSIVHSLEFPGQTANSNNSSPK